MVNHSSAAHVVTRAPRAISSSGHDLGSPSPAISNSSSGESDSGDEGNRHHSSSSPSRGRNVDRLRRPGMPGRMSSGTLIVPRDVAEVEVEEDYGPEDARTMSPRRTSEELDRLGESAREALLQYVEVDMR
jgi:hypothetical protein